MKVNLANPKEHHIPTDGTALKDPAFCRALLGIMMHKMGVTVIEFTQEDFDAIPGRFVAEGTNEENGNFLIGIMTPEEALKGAKREAH